MGFSERREPIVAGAFYPADPGELRRMVEGYIVAPAGTVAAIGCVMPHAGYLYSGKVAGRTMGEVMVKDRAILFGPNHTGAGPALSVADFSEWSTPLGAVQTDRALAQALLDADSTLAPDRTAHEDEHSLEVLLPFLYCQNPRVRIVPVAVKTDDLEALRRTAGRIAATLKTLGLSSDVLLVASSDMTHYESEHEARRKDTAAIHAMRSLDEEKLFEAVGRLHISMCGYAPVALMLACARELGAGSARLVMYQTSAEQTHDRSSVVGYAGIIVE